jgi:capsular exopolysaccharide synthesis family protein
MTRRYTSVAEIQVQKPSADTLGGDSAGGGAGGGETDGSASKLTVQTEATVLQSPALAMKVIQDLHLEDTNDFKPHFNLVSWVSGLFSPTPVPDPPGASLEASPRRRDRVLRTFKDNLEVKIVPGTQVVEIAFTSSDPNVAAKTVNHLIDSLVEYTMQAHNSTTEQASKWLESQLVDLKTQTDELQNKLIRLQKDTGAVQVAGDSDADGHGQVYSSAVDQFQKANAALSQAQTNRILKGAIYEVVKSGNPETIMGLPSNSALAGAAAGMSGELSVISNLRTQEATVTGQINEMLAKYGANYPKVAELKAQQASIETSIHDELNRMRDRAYNEYVVAQNIETSAKQLYDSQKQHADVANDKAVQYELVRQQFEQSRALYEKLLGRLKEAGAMQGFHTTNVEIVSSALAPSEPSRPDVPLYLGGSIGAGLLLGCIMAFLVDALDTKIVDIHGLEALIGHAPFGVLPSYETKKKGLRLSGHTFTAPGGEFVPALKEPHSPYVESLRALRTALLSSPGGAPPQIILVTSSTEGEGKSSLSANLAVLLAHQGKHVLLVDADLRRPHLHVAFGISSEVGLSTILGGKVDPDALSTATLRLEAVPGLDILLSGPIPTYSAELLGSSKMKQALDLWRARYDFIILDGAPVLPVTDSVVLSSQADATLLVARYESTQQQSLDRSIRTLRGQLGSNRQIGVVLNGVERTASAYYKYYGYSQSTYYKKQLGGGNGISS